MSQNLIVAVLSGDLVKSKGLDDKRQGVMDGLLQAIEGARGYLAKKTVGSFFQVFIAAMLSNAPCLIRDFRFGPRYT